MIKSKRNKLNTQKGMTMAEMLITVAIIIILAGVAFIAIMSYMRSMAQLERDKIAKELFIAAQNHLTMIKGENYPGISTDFLKLSDSESDESGSSGSVSQDSLNNADKEAGTKESEVLNDGDDNIRYILVNKGSIFNSTSNENGSAMIKQMLPIGAIDETVRLGGSYVIRYQPSMGKVLDVFYCSQNGSRYDYELTSNDYNNSNTYGLLNMNKKNAKEYRREFNGDKVLGWYGGENLDALGTKINAPKLTVANGDRLLANVEWTDNNKKSDAEIKLKLIIKGKQSGKEMVYNDTSSTVTGMNTGIDTSSISTSSMLGTSTVTTSKKTLNSASVDLPLIGSIGVGHMPKQGTLGQVIRSLTNTGNSVVKAYVLDDITSTNTHFASIVKNAEDGPAKLIPGEDIEIKAVVYCTNFLANVAESKVKVTNSLFAAISDEKAGSNNTPYTLNNDIITISDSGSGTDASLPDTAYINSMRHLENLDARISGLDLNDGSGINTGLSGNNGNNTGSNSTLSNSKKLDIRAAIQTEDLNWNAFIQNEELAAKQVNSMENAATSISLFNPAKSTTTIDSTTFCFKPVIPPSGTDKGFKYNGRKHKITNLMADFKENENSGLFAKVKGGTIKNLELVDFEIKPSSGEQAAGNAGMLAGELESTTVTNVIGITGSDKKSSVVVSGKNSGGLVGTLTGNGKVEYCAAAVRVSGTSNAGGLVGSASESSEITGCYSGGHTKNGSYEDNTASGQILYDVISAAGNAGGLVGSFSGTKVENSYSTCSANGSSTVGGFVGTASGTITKCYCTGLVSDSKAADNKHAFVGSGSVGTGNKYYAIINTTGSGKDINEMQPGDDGVKAFDEDTEAFAEFTVAGIESHPYDEYINDNNKGIKGKFIFKPISELAGSVPSGYYVNEHYGDWPQPEIFVINN